MKIASILLGCVGVINLLPVVGLLNITRLESAYGINLVSGDLIILMQHRALLFGLIGGFIIYSVFNPSYQPAAMLMAAISMIGFAILVHLQGGANQAITHVLYVDYCGIILLLVAAVLKYLFSIS